MPTSAFGLITDLQSRAESENQSALAVIVDWIAVKFAYNSEHRRSGMRLSQQAVDLCDRPRACKNPGACVWSFPVTASQACPEAIVSVVTASRAVKLLSLQHCTALLSEAFPVRFSFLCIMKDF